MPPLDIQAQIVVVCRQNEKPAEDDCLLCVDSLSVWICAFKQVRALSSPPNC